MNWMEEVDQFLAAEDPAVGDMSTLEAQLEQSNVSGVLHFIALLNFEYFTYFEKHFDC